MVEYDQTAAHIHHAPDFGIRLPDSFDMTTYKNLERSAKIEYAKQKLSPEIIINYQNKIAKSITPRFVPVPKKGVDFKVVPGFVGTRKRDSDLTITPMESNSNKVMLGIIREDGVHITSYPVKLTKLKRIALVDGFWVLKERNL